MAKFFIAFLGCCVLGVSIGSGKRAFNTATLTVQVQNVKSAKGKILLALFNQADGFPEASQKAFRLMDAAPRTGTTTVQFENLPAGTYALAVFHDANGDGKLNTNAVGFPKEAYGFSNNARPTFSAPGFKEASFTCTQAKTISINIK